METVESFLLRARARGLVTQPQLAALLDLCRTPPMNAVADLDLPADEGPPVAEAESPRLVRGFHDVLITIGAVAALAGLWGFALTLLGFASAYVVLAAVVFLAEILVARQRLALPAVALTAFFGGATFVAVAPLVDAIAFGVGSDLTLGVLALAFLAFWRRYRIPVALAAAFAAFVASLFSVTMLTLSGMAALENALQSRPLLSAFVGLLFSAALFAVAMAFDMQDRLRLTKRSDVAFWLHLAAAPALFASAFALAFSASGPDFWWMTNPGLREALIALAIVAAMMLIGIVIDRRAFVTSGLISLGGSIAALARFADIDIRAYATVPLFAVGVVVLLLGTGWQTLRRRAVGSLPTAIRSRVPPA